MAAVDSVPERMSHPLAVGASPAVIREWLTAEDARSFVEQYDAALDAARTTLDLGEVHDVVERWRRIAVLQTDPAGYRRTLRRAAELATGEESPADEALDVTRTKAGF